MSQALRDLISPEAFAPHGHGSPWEPALAWLQVVSSAAIGLSSVAIAATLGYLAKKARDRPLRGVALALGLFVVACGVTHVFDVRALGRPASWLDGSVRAIAAVASVTTALLLPRLVPRAIELARGARSLHERGAAPTTALDDPGRPHARTEEADRRRTELLANVGHELRTPLTLMLGPAERLLAGGALDPAQRRDVELIVHNGRVLLEHVNDLLDAARLEAGRLTPTYARVELDRLVRRVAACFDGLADERGIAYRVEAPSPLHAEVDPDELGRVLLNLLSNAFRRAPPGGTVRCEASVVEGEGRELVRLEVADDGPGIAPEHRARVFERFVQGDGAALQGGTGLGLAIAKEVVELHGGTIEVSEAPEGGARFVVELPRSAPPGTSLVPLAEPAPSPAQGAPRPRGDAEASGAPSASLTPRAEPARVRERDPEGSRLETHVLRLVSHELGSPLATLQLQLERLQAELGAAQGAPGRLVRRMLGSAGRLRELVEGLVSYSRIRDGGQDVRAEPIDVPALCRAVLDEQREPAQAKGLVLRVEPASEPATLRSDPELVRLVLGSLVGTAVKLTEAGCVTIRIERSGDACRIAVHDTGPGIPAEVRERVFEPFEPLEPTSRRHASGAGLGLALVRELVQALGGSISLESEVGVGSTFTVVLPDRP